MAIACTNKDTTAVARTPSRNENLGSALVKLPKK